MKPIRVALVGSGGMARNYRKVYANLPGVEFTTAIDPNPTALEECRPFTQRQSSDFAEALRDDIDLVDVSTPNHLHAQQAIAALEAGKHVLLQKPISNTLEDARRIVDAASKAKGKLGMYMSSYTNPLVWEIRRIIEQGCVGRVQSIRARDAHRGGLNAKPTATNWRASRDRTGGGSFTQLSIHAVNLMRYWLGTEISEIFAYSANQYSPNIGGDDVTVAAARFAAPSADYPDFFGVFESGWASEGSQREIFGTRGTILITHENSRVDLCLETDFHGKWIDYCNPGEWRTFAVPNAPLEDATNPCNQQRMFIEAIRENRPPHMSGEQGLRDFAVINAAYESAETGKPCAPRL